MLLSINRGIFISWNFGTIMAPTLYMIPASPPVRSVQITAKALGIDLQLKQLDFYKAEHLGPDYLKINPQHTVPSLVDDDGFTVWDSHAINAYLVSKYGKDDSLYPKDLKKRALVDQRMHFDSGVAFATAVGIIRPLIRDLKTGLDGTDKENLASVYAFLEAFLDGNQWMAGDAKTIADYHLYAIVTASNVLVPVDSQTYPRLSSWLKKVDSLPEVEVSRAGLAMFEGMLKSKLK